MCSSCFIIDSNQQVMIMEPPYVLQQAKKEIKASIEWEKVVQNLCILLEQLENDSGRQQLRNFEGLSKQEKHVLMRQVAKQVQKTSAFRDLQSKIRTLAQPAVTIPSRVFLHADDKLQHTETRNESFLNPSFSKLESEHAANACAYLLEEHHHLKHYLKKCFNHPLPADLRVTAWKVLLQPYSSAVRQESLLKTRCYSVDRFKEERVIAKKCEATLRSSPFFSKLARSPTTLEAMQSIVSFWSCYKDDRPSDINFLLCIPFLYAWQDNLERESRALGTGIRSLQQMQASLNDIAEVYINFMEKFLSEPSMNMVKTVDDSVQEVEDLLKVESPTLYKHLVRILASNFQADRDPHSQSHVHLRKIIHIQLQKMFVGDLPMEVVCYIWDQCFIGATVSGFRSLKYFATCWFIILKHQLITCQSEEDVRRVLMDKHCSPRIAQFQSEIDKRFLHWISSRLEVVPFQIKVPLSVKHKKVTSITYPVRSPPSISVHASRRQQQPVTGRVSSQKHVKDKEKHKFEENSDLLEQEKEKHRKELEDLTLEVELLRRKIESLNERPVTTRSSVLIEAAPSENLLSVSPIPDSSTLLKCDSSDHQQHTSHQPMVSPSEVVAHDQPSQIQEISQSITSAAKPKRPFSPGNLTKDDVTNIWFMIFKRFTSAVSLIFHGNEKNRKYTNSQEGSLVLDQDHSVHI